MRLLAELKPPTKEGMARTGIGVAFENLGLVDPYEFPRESDNPLPNANPKSYSPNIEL
tara:strand:- start:514 stop:687 length:174 start_codon:yes stop_codon:yes gene_type:complete